MDRYYTDQEIYDRGYTSRAAFNRAKAIEDRIKRESERLAANTAVGHESRSSDRFMPAGSAGVPPSVNRLAEENRREMEQKGRELYQRFILHRQAGIPVNYEKAAFGNLLGFNRGTIREFEVYFNSPECAARFGAQQ
jgi:hypothetical protein